METPTMKSILDSTRQFIEVKRAEFKDNLDKSAADKELDMSGAGDDSPKTRGQGLEADQPASISVKKEPAITADANAEPEAGGSGTAETAAGKEEDNKTDRKDKLEAEDAAPVSVEKKPLISDNIDAKVATGVSKLANEILDDIHGWQKTQQVAAPAKKAEPEKEKKDDKQAAGPEMELTTDVLAKIAAMILSTEEGAAFVEGSLAKAAGAEAAQETLGFLAEQSELAEKEAAYGQGQSDAEALTQQAIFDAGVDSVKAPVAKATKVAEAGTFSKLGQAVADASIADLMGGGAGVDAGAEGAGAEGAGIADLMGGGAGAEGAGIEEAGAEEEFSIEDIQAALEAMVSEGAISAEEAQQVVEYITQAQEAEGEVAPEGAEGIVAPEEGAVAPEGEVAPEGIVAPEAGLEAVAADKSSAASTLIDAIHKAQKARK